MSPLCLSNPSFLAMIAYGCIAIPFSTLIIITIIWKRKNFKGNFYRIYIVMAIHEMIMYFVKYPIIRLPLFTGSGCPLEGFFEAGHFFGLNVIHFIHWHVGFTVLILESTIAFDRLVCILLDSKWKQKWNNSYRWMILFAIVFPVVISHVLLLTDSTYEYLENLDNYQIVTVVNYRGYLYTGAIVMLLFCTTASLIMNSTVLYAFCSGRFKIISNQRRTEFKLFIYSMIELFSEILMIIVLALQQFSSMESPLHNFSRYLLLFTQDAVTLFPPFVLLATSTQLRQAIAEILFGRIATTVNTVTLNSKR